MSLLLLDEQSKAGPFVKYPSLSGIWEEKFRQKVQDAGHEDASVPWAVQEKIHGCNISFWITCNQTRVAKRTTFLSPTEKFYGAQAMADNPAFDKLLELAKNIDPTIVECVVYGELHGGFAPNDKQRVKGVQPPVQREVVYSRHHKLLFFDVAVRRLNSSDLSFMHLATAQALVETAELQFVPLLFVGTAQECIDYSAKHRKLPTGHLDDDLKDDLKDENIREGHVIRPLEHTRMPSGSTVAYKDKNESFYERCRFKIPRGNINGSDVGKAATHLKQFATDQRVVSICSQSGPFTKADIGRVIQLVFKDALKDAQKADDSDQFNEVWNRLTATETKSVQKQVMAKISEHVRKVVCTE